jgi:predicted phosphodiesterase
MTTLISADWHLSSKSEEEYRWSVFHSLLEIERTSPVVIDRLLFLGDFTEKKDKHSAAFINRFVDSITQLADKFGKLIIVSGNHDFIDSDLPFFRFLDCINNITFIYSKPWIRNYEAFVPCYQSKEVPTEYLAGTEKCKTIYTHLNFKGAIGDNGHVLEGVDPSIFANNGSVVFSGHIHVPQILGNITYVGAPYPIDFGDNYTGRFLLIKDNGDIESIENKSIKRLMIDLYSIADLEGLDSNCQTKVRLHLPVSELHKYTSLREEVIMYHKRVNAILHSLELVVVSPEKCSEEGSFKMGNLSKEDLIHIYGKMAKLDYDYIESAIRMVNSNA